MAENKRSCFEPNGFIFDKNRAMPHQPRFSHRNQSGTNMVGLLTRSTSHPLQPFHLWQLPGWDKSGAWCRQKMEITPTKPKEKSRSNQIAMHRELGVFPRPYHPPQEFQGFFTTPGTTLVPKCHDKGKTRPQGAWLPMLGQPCSAGEGKYFRQRFSCDLC